MEVCTDRQHLINKTQHFATAKKKGAVNMAIEKGLLIHWWHYYGKVIYTLAELEEFEKVIDEYGADKVLDVAVASYVCGDGSPTIMLASIRKGTVKKLFESLPDISKMGKKEKEQYEIVRDKFVQIISQTT